MKHPFYFVAVLAVPAIIFFACSKSTSDQSISETLIAQAPIPSNLNYQCANAPDYGDSIVYLQPSKTDYIIYPVNKTALGNGTYFAWPTGLLLDSATGAIDLSGSESGMRYIIGFVKAGSTDTCVKNLIVAGVTYADSIYTLSDNDTLAIPYYNANAATPAVCDASDDNDYPGNTGYGNGDNKCVFDGPDKKGKKGQANAQNVKVRTISGVINLKATLAAGAFGTNPLDGASLLVPITYSLNDKSKKAIQQINVQLIYYSQRSAIPAPLVNTIQANRTAFFQNAPVLNAPRPPIIIVSRTN